MKKIPFIILCSLATVAIGLSTWSLIRSYQPAPDMTTEYVMYVGTNDKETYQLEKTKEECRDIVHNTLMDHFPDGFTMYTADGVWRDETKHVTIEYTFVCVLETDQKAAVYATADELLTKLNQSTILIVSNAVKLVDFYTGA